MNLANENVPRDSSKMLAKKTSEIYIICEFINNKSCITHCMRDNNFSSSSERVEFQSEFD